MFLARRAAAPARTLLRRQQPRRFDSSSAPHGGGHHHPEPANESLGLGFYVFAASIPCGLALYKYSTSESGEKHWITRLIEEYSPKESTWEQRNALHTVAMEKAAHDRHLFHSQDPPVTIDLGYPEIFNTGSIINVPAGNGSADLRAVAAHYEQRRRDVEERRVARMKDGKVVTIYDDGRYF